MKRIVIPTDFSTNSIHAIDFAVHKLGDDDCKFTILHVYQIPQGGQSGLFYLLEEMNKQATADMEELMEKLSTRYTNKKPDFEAKVLQGDLADQTNAIAQEQGADCVVMGTKGASGIKEVLIGSNAVRLMGALKVPMYAVPAEQEYKAIKEVMVAYDGQEPIEEACQAIMTFPKRHQLPLTFFHVMTKEGKEVDNWDKMKEIFGDLQIKLIEVEAEEFEEGLEKITEDKEALLVLVRHKKSFWERLFNISDSRKALMHAKLPILVIPE
jgi:nucleotide-binding universal stress UspA family protein